MDRSKRGKPHVQDEEGVKDSETARARCAGDRGSGRYRR